MTRIRFLAIDAFLLYWHGESRRHASSALRAVAGNQFSLVFGHNSMRYSQPQSGAAPALGEKRLGNIWQVLLQNAETRIHNNTLKPALVTVINLERLHSEG